MVSIKLEAKSYDQGYLDGYNRKPFKKQGDGLSYSSGYIEGKADRDRPERLVSRR